MSSSEGSCICKGDLDNDGKDDLYIGDQVDILERYFYLEVESIKNKIMFF